MDGKRNREKKGKKEYIYIKYLKADGKIFVLDRLKDL